MAQPDSAASGRERTISFYELVKWVSGSTSVRMKHADWDAILAGLENRPLRDRVLTTPSKTFIGEVMSVAGERHLKLMSVRDQHAWLEVYDPTAGSIDALDLGESNQLLETSIVAFLKFGNVIGFILGSTSAPTPTSLEQWINGLQILGGTTIEAQVMVSHEVQQLLKKSSEVSMVRVRTHTNKAEALRARGSGLSDVLDAVKSKYGDLEVEVILRVSRKKAESDRRRLLREEAKLIANASDANEVEKADAKLIYIQADDRTRTEDVEFAKQRITAKRTIGTTSEDGSPIRNESAVLAILEVADAHDDELRKIVKGS